MRFRFIDYYTRRTAYQIWLFDVDLSEQEYLRIVEQFRYHCRKADVSWICGYSTTSSDDAHAEYLRTGKRGRPKRVVSGSGVDAHQHNLMIGTESNSAYSTAHRICKALNKKYKRKVAQVHSVSDGKHLCNSIGYITRQSDVLRTGGSFNFKEYYDRTNEFFC